MHAHLLTPPALVNRMALLAFLLVALALPTTHASCPLLQGLCDANRNATGGGASGQCGDHAVRCSGSEGWHIQFYGEGDWCTIKEFSHEDRVLVVQDPGVNSRLTHSDCGLVYSFPPPAPPLPRPIAFQNRLRSFSGVHVFNCDVGTYNFSSDVFTGAYNASGCAGYDLYYAFEYPGQRPEDGSCAGGANFFEWRLQLDESGRNLSVLSAGFSHQRKLLPDCFTCRMSRREDCSPMAVAGSNSTACSCSRTCSAASSKMISTSKMRIIIGVVTLGFLLSWVFILYCCCRQKICYLFWKWKSRNIQNVEEFLEQYGSLIPKRYNYSDVKRMTKCFSKKLGHGGYGKVFRGQLGNGRLVAVKLLNESKGNGEEFVNEVASIGRTYHVNIVSLLGFCSEGRKRALIYEFMPNGSLEKFIFSERARDTVGWKKTYEIAVGIARGLEYLHRGCNIVHFDIKPQNILLDQDFCPKISDFGLAKLCRPKESVLSMAGIRGTIGYIAPEVFSRNFGVISAKSDVYSYGMMVLEMVSQRKNAEVRLHEVSDVYFPHWVFEQLVSVGHLGIPGVTSETEGIAKKMVLVGLWCIQTHPRSRPSMSNVLEMLEGNIEDLQMPPKPYLLSPITSRSSSYVSSQSI